MSSSEEGTEKSRLFRRSAGYVKEKNRMRTLVFVLALVVALAAPVAAQNQGAVQAPQTVQLQLVPNQQTLAPGVYTIEQPAPMRGAQGPRGLQGVPGNVGPVGPQGAAGPQGPAGRLDWPVFLLVWLMLLLPLGALIWAIRQMPQQAGAVVPAVQPNVVPLPNGGQMQLPPGMALVHVSVNGAGATVTNGNIS